MQNTVRVLSEHLKQSNNSVKLEIPKVTKKASTIVKNYLPNLVNENAREKLRLLHVLSQQNKNIQIT